MALGICREFSDHPTIHSDHPIYGRNSSKEKPGLPISSACGILHRSGTPDGKVPPEKILYRIAAHRSSTAGPLAKQKKKGRFERI
jgi:hypothetical protein